MTGTQKHYAWKQGRELAGELSEALGRENYGTATELAEKLETLGVQSLDRLMPRGTLEFAAGDRWGEEHTRAILDRLNRRLTEPLTAHLLVVLGYWAGEEAVPVIRQIVVERAKRELSPETVQTIRSGLRALHLIGGSLATQTLCALQTSAFPKDVRTPAAWFLNELGGRREDPLFDSEPRHLSAEEVLRRDSLDDPYHWREAAEKLRDDFILDGRWGLGDHHDVLWKVLPEKEAATVARAFADSPEERWQGELLNAIELVVPQFMIRLAPSQLLVFRAVMNFFPDTEGAAEIPGLKDWARVGLQPESKAVSHLNELAIFDPGERDVSGELQMRGLVRDWMSVPLHLAQQFGRRKLYPLVVSMAAFTHHLQKELAFAHVMSFPEILRSMFRGFLPRA